MLVSLVEECIFASVEFQFHCTVSFTLMVELVGLKKLSPTATVTVAAIAVEDAIGTVNDPSKITLRARQRELLSIQSVGFEVAV